MNSEEFRIGLLNYFDQFKRTLATKEGDWVIKGFIDVYRNIYYSIPKFESILAVV